MRKPDYENLRRLAQDRDMLERSFRRLLRNRPAGIVAIFLRELAAARRRAAPFGFGWLRLALSGLAVPRPAFGGLVPRPVPVLLRVPRLWLGRLAPVLLGLILPLAAAAGVWVWHEATQVVAVVERNRACAQVTVFTDAEGAILGARPVLGAETCGTARPQVTAAFDRETEVRFARAIAAIEGAYSTSSRWVWFGHDVRGVARKAASLVGLLPGRGMSGPILSAFEALAGEADGVSWPRKIVLMVAASRFTWTELPTDAAREAFITRHMVTVTRTGADRGGRLGAEMIFAGRGPQSLADLCVLARAAGFPLWAVSDARVSPRAASSWTNAVGPGAAACVRALAASPAEAAEALAELRAACGGTDLCLSPPDPDAVPGVPPAMARRGLDEARIEIARHRLPQFRPLGLAAGAGLGVIDLLRLAGLEEEPVVPTTLSRQMTAAFERDIPQALDRLGRRLPAESCLVGRCRHRVDHAIVLAEVTEEGRALIRAVHANRHGAFAGWPQRDPATGGWTAHPSRYGLASTAKAMLVVVARNRGVNRLCNNPAGGPRCRDGSWIALEDAISRSMSHPFRWLATEYRDDIARIQGAFGREAEPGPGSAFDAAYGIGASSLTPTEAVQLFAALAAGEGGEVRLFPDRPIAPALDLGARGIAPAAVAGACTVLAAPLQPGGTLAATGQMLAEEGVQPLCGKSGTHTEGGIDQVLTSTLAFQTAAGRRFVLHVSVVATDRTQGLGRLGHADLVPLQRAALRAVLH